MGLGAVREGPSADLALKDQDCDKYAQPDRKHLGLGDREQIPHRGEPGALGGHFDNLLADATKVAKVAHHAALPWTEIGEFMSELHPRAGSAARAVEFGILKAARSGEIRGALG